MKESIVFEDLEHIAEKNNIKICTVNLKKYAFGIKSGLCKVRGDYRVILDKHLHLSEKIDVLIDALQTAAVDTEEMPPYLKRLFQKKTLPGNDLEEESGCRTADT
jgi:hypothetical protein